MVSRSDREDFCAYEVEWKFVHSRFFRGRLRSEIDGPNIAWSPQKVNGVFDSLDDIGIRPAVDVRRGGEHFASGLGVDVEPAVR